MNTPQTFHTAHGYTVTATRRGIEIDLETKNAKGEVISTVVMSEYAATLLLEDLADNGVDAPALEAAWNNGYSEGRDAA